MDTEQHDTNFNNQVQIETINMGLFYTASPKELLQLRNKVFVDFGLPALKNKSFQQSPFNAWFGKSEIGYSYQLCRLSGKAELEIVEVNIVRGDRSIQISLNIFDLHPTIDSLQQLKGLSVVNFGIPPCSQSNMQLRIDDIKGPPILNYDHMFRSHKIKSYHTKAGLAKRANQLGAIIEKDMNHIDTFVKRWHEIHRPLTTTWEGTPINTKFQTGSTTASAQQNV